MYSGYGIGFDSLSEFLLTDGSVDKTVVIFRVDVSSSVHTDNKRNVLILDKEPTQGLDNATLTSKAKYPINFTELGKKNYVCTIMKATVSYFLMLQKYVR